MNLGTKLVNPVVGALVTGAVATALTRNNHQLNQPDNMYNPKLKITAPNNIFFNPPIKKPSFKMPEIYPNNTGRQLKRKSESIKLDNIDKYIKDAIKSPIKTPEVEENPKRSSYKRKTPSKSSNRSSETRKKQPEINTDKIQKQLKEYMKGATNPLYNNKPAPLNNTNSATKKANKSPSKNSNMSSEKRINSNLHINKQEIKEELKEYVTKKIKNAVEEFKSNVKHLQFALIAAWTKVLNTFVKGVPPIPTPKVITSGKQKIYDRLNELILKGKKVYDEKQLDDHIIMEDGNYSFMWEPGTNLLLDKYNQNCIMPIMRVQSFNYKEIPEFRETYKMDDNFWNKINLNYAEVNDSEVVKRWQKERDYEDENRLYRGKRNELIRINNYRYVWLEYKNNGEYDFISQKNYESKAEMIRGRIKECLDKNPNLDIIHISIELPMHANGLIYKVKENKFYHFEPHGQYAEKLREGGFDEFADENDDSRLKEMMELFTKSIFKDSRYSPPEETSPIPEKGLQELENMAVRRLDMRQIGEGFCTTWTMFFLSMALLAPEVKINELQEIITNHVNPDHMLFLILGFLKELMEEMPSFAEKIIKEYHADIELEDDTFFTKKNLKKISKSMLKGKMQ